MQENRYPEKIASIEGKGCKGALESERYTG